MAEDPELWPRLVGWVGEQLAARAGRTLLLGIVGVPGCGKSTLAARLARSLAAVPSLIVSLDDFYLTPAQRDERGLRWRGPPGTHDLRLLDRFLVQLTTGAAPLEVPVFDRNHERRLPAREQPGPLALCILEGWFVGARAPGYERLADSLDRLIYLDMEIAAARAARCAREAAVRRLGAGGMSEADTLRFWDEAIAPHLQTLVRPLRDRADARLTVSPTHALSELWLAPPADGPCGTPGCRR